MPCEYCSPGEGWCPCCCCLSAMVCVVLLFAYHVAAGLGGQAMIGAYLLGLDCRRASGRDLCLSLLMIASLNPGHSARAETRQMLDQVPHDVRCLSPGRQCRILGRNLPLIRRLSRQDRNVQQRTRAPTWLTTSEFQVGSLRHDDPWNVSNVILLPHTRRGAEAAGKRWDGRRGRDRRRLELPLRA